MTVTSTSSRILHSLSGLSHPILRLILSAVRGHLDNYSDGGLQTTVLLLRYTLVYIPCIIIYFPSLTVELEQAGL